MWPILAVLGLASTQGEPQLPDSQRAGLIAFYQSTGGNGWRRHSGWTTRTSACEWEGVMCGYQYSKESGQTAVVEGLWLTDNLLSGRLPPNLRELLPDLKVLSVDLNNLTGPVPESILTAWDQETFEFRGAGNHFSNLVEWARIVSDTIGTLCSAGEDVTWSLELASGGEARFESVRCKPGTERDTQCLVREGHAFGLERVARALDAVSARGLAPEYNLPFSAATHQRKLVTSVRFGDKSEWRLTTYDREGPIQAWVAQSVLLSLLDNVSWRAEKVVPKCHTWQ